MFVDILMVETLRSETFPELFCSALLGQIGERNLMPNHVILQSKYLSFLTCANLVVVFLRS